jgi:hypothetical protein
MNFLRLQVSGRARWPEELKPSIQNGPKDGSGSKCEELA